MKKQALLFFALLFSVYAFGQGVRYDVPPILNSRAVLVPNANISLCPGTATITNSTCSPASTQAFTDITLTTPCATGSPVVLPQTNVCSGVADALGNAGFWLSPGAYIYCINGPTITGKCYNLTVPVGTTTAGVIPSLAPSNLNNIRYVDGVKFTTCDAAVNDIQALNPVIANSPSGATESGSTVTITTTAAHGLQANQTIFISGVGVAGYNGNAVVLSTGLTATQFTFTSPNTGLSASGGGTVGLAGIVMIPPTYTGPSCSTFVNQDGEPESRTPENITVMDHRAVNVAENINYGGTTFLALARFNVWQRKVSPTLTTSAILGTNQVEGTLPNNQTLASITGEVDIQNSITPGTGVVAAIEAYTAIRSTNGGTIPDARGFVGSVNFDRAASTTNVTSMTTGYFQGCTNGSSTSTVANCYSGLFEGPIKGTTRNYAIFSEGHQLFLQGAHFDVCNGCLLNGGGTPVTGMTLRTTDINFSLPMTLNTALVGSDSVDLNQAGTTPTILRFLRGAVGKGFIANEGTASSVLNGGAQDDLSIGSGGANINFGTASSNAFAQFTSGGRFLLGGGISTAAPPTGNTGFQHKRVAGCATAASLNATCDTTVTWTSAFADANYTATCTGDVVTSGVPIVEGIDISAAKVGASITVRTISITAAAAQFTTLDCVAVHD